MKRINLLIFIFAIFGTSILFADPEKAVKEYTIEQFLTTTTISGSSFSHDDSQILFTSNKSGVFNLYTVPVTGGEAKQLTNSPKTTFSISYFPNDDRILFRQDEGGDENYHIYVRESDGTIKDLTPGTKFTAFFER